MAGGKRHAQATKRRLLWLLPVSGIGYLIEPQCIGLAVGSVIGHLLTPDIDHHYTTYEELRIYRYNKLLGFLWWLYWLPYERIVPHRGISHVPIVGTATRFVYLLWLPLWYTEGYGLFWFSVFVTWCIQDAAHLRLDRKKKKNAKHSHNKSRIHSYRRHRNH